MHRIDTPENVGSLPTLDAIGTAGYFTKGTTGVNDATVPGQDWFNMIQEEVAHVVEQAALTPDQTKVDWTQLYQAILILAANEITLDALDYPTISTSDNRITVTPASATNGGTVAIPADVMVSLAKEATAGETGIRQVVKTAIFTSSDLAVSSAYYLRAKFIGDTWTVYTQKGTDTDSIPAGLVGTVDGSSGGGFDSTVLDILFAKVVTGTTGSVPAIIELANSKLLSFNSDQSLITDTTTNQDVTHTFTFNYNFARSPGSVNHSAGLSYLNNAINAVKSTFIDINRYDFLCEVVTSAPGTGILSNVNIYCNAGVIA